MKPKDVLTLLEIIDLSSQSPTYAHITAAAHQALLNATMPVLPEHDDGNDEEKSSSPPPRPSTPPRPPLPPGRV